MITALLLTFVAFLIIGVPIAFAMGLSGIIALALFSSVPLLIIPQRIFASLDSFSLLAVPLFVLAGELMNIGGITERIVRLSRAGVGHLRGGLAQASIIANMFMSALSGSAVADLVAVGSVMIPTMTKQGYRKEYSVAVTSCAALMGPIIPPSIVAVIYGSLTGVSIGALFVAGILPGLIAGFGIMVLAWALAKRGNATPLPKASWVEFGSAAVGSLPALVVPIIILGGILGGVFTPTEAGAVAAFYALIFGLVRGRHSPVGLFNLFLNAGIITASALITLAGASIFSYVLISGGFAQTALTTLLAMTSDPSIAMLIMIAGLFILGLAVEPIPALIMIIPVLMPAVQHFGLDPIQFGMVAIMMLVLGSLTPPIGVLAMIACRIADLEYGRSLPMLTPFMLWWVVVTLIVAFVPPVTLWLPELLIP
jgi:C4-dicarboxylate transporter DctM subunit